ncbi:MAG: toprim domain-containing protein [Thiohalospira sp.]
MNCKQANEISIIEFLKKLNIYPVRQSGRYTFYFSPFRQETKPSFVVTNKNRWRDFGSGKGGTLVDFVMELQNCNESQALRFIVNTGCSFSFKEQNFIEESNIKIRNIRPFVKHKALLDYLKDRAIKPLESVKGELKEIWYTKDSKLFFGIAFENDQGGFEMRNKFYKNCIGRKAITTRLKGSQTIVLFEGFMDYLSYFILGWNSDSEDYLIMNSTSMLSETIPVVMKYKKVIAFLDNDDSGQKCFNKIKKEVPWIINQSKKIIPFKDLNEFLMNQKK